MNRRNFLGAMTAATAAGVSVVPEIRPGAIDLWQIEPQPRQFDFEEAGSVCMDVSVMGVGAALGKLGWDSADPVKPLLVMQPEWYPYALEIAYEFNQRIAVWVTPFSEERRYRDAWFVVWRGRRVGSEGA